MLFNKIADYQTIHDEAEREKEAVTAAIILTVQLHSGITITSCFNLR